MKLTPNLFFQSFFNLTETVASKYNKLAQDIKAYRQKKSIEYLAKIPFSDLKVFEKVLPALPANSQLHISNSSPIRYAQLFDIEKLFHNHVYWENQPLVSYMLKKNILLHYPTYPHIHTLIAEQKWGDSQLEK